jgi:hypothetical protein
MAGLLDWRSSYVDIVTRATCRRGKPVEVLIGRWSQSQTSLERPPQLRGGLGSSPFPFITIAAH